MKHVLKLLQRCQRGLKPLAPDIEAHATHVRDDLRDTASTGRSNVV